VRMQASRRRVQFSPSLYYFISLLVAALFAVELLIWLIDGRAWTSRVGRVSEWGALRPQNSPVI